MFRHPKKLKFASADKYCTYPVHPQTTYIHSSKTVETRLLTNQLLPKVQEVSQDIQETSEPHNSGTKSDPVPGISYLYSTCPSYLLE